VHARFWLCLTRSFRLETHAEKSGRILASSLLAADSAGRNNLPRLSGRYSGIASTLPGRFDWMASCVRYGRESWFHSSLGQQEIVNNSETEIRALTARLRGDSETVASRLATGEPADVVAVIFLRYFAGIQLQRLGVTNTLVKMTVYRLPYHCYFNVISTRKPGWL